MADEMNKDREQGRRDFVRKAAYVAPAILTLQAFSAVAKAGSVKDIGSFKDKEKDPKKVKIKLKDKP